MELKIEPELKALIPPLTNDEYRLLEEGSLGFKSEDMTLIITPSDIGPLWFHAQLFDTESQTEHYTKRPMAFSRLSALMPYYDAIRGKALVPVEMDPKPLEYNERVVSNSYKERTNVYFIQSVMGGPVKIGKADDIQERLRQHQTGSPFILEVIKTYENVEPKFEKELHDKFKEYRIHGEWFDEKILSLI